MSRDDIIYIGIEEHPVTLGEFAEKMCESEANQLAMMGIYYDKEKAIEQFINSFKDKKEKVIVII